MSELYGFAVKTIDGGDAIMADFAGKVLLVVNVASKCGFTPQYAGLEALYRKYRDKGFAVLGFPCNQFAAQEPGDEDEIATFCTSRYDVTFPMFSKIDVNGAGAHPLYAYLKEQRPGIAGSKAVKWNFTKFLIDRDGRVIERFAPQARPAAIEADIAKLL